MASSCAAREANTRTIKPLRKTIAPIASMMPRYTHSDNAGPTAEVCPIVRLSLSDYLPVHLGML